MDSRPVAQEPFHYHDPMNTLHTTDQRVRQRTVWPVLQGLLCACLLGATLSANAQDQAKLRADESIGNSVLDAALFYQLLLGELNVIGGEAGTGYSLILDAARKQSDAQLFKRAVDIALQARSGDAALAAARAWSEAIPGSVDADRFQLQILLALNRVSETGAVLRRLVAQAPGPRRTDAINSIPQIYARVPDKKAALKVVREALGPSLKAPSLAAAAWSSIGFLEVMDKQLPQALVSARNGHAADPSSPFPALLALELMGLGHNAAETVVIGQLKARPPTAGSTPNVALAYARILYDLQRHAEARVQLESLTREQPDAMEPWLLLATLQVQGKRFSDAAQSLQTFMGLARQAGDEASTRGLTQAYLLMAQIAEAQKDYAGADAWLNRIDNADGIMAAQIRRASLLAHQGQMDKARTLLRNHPERRPEDARLKFVAEAQLLSDFKEWEQAYDVYGEAVTRFPEDMELVYNQAMMAEKSNRLDAMERLLRQIIAIDPDHHQAYNALGYSLADRQLRLPEAKELIERAAKLAPEDAFIQDSLGWVEFRLGNFQRAADILRVAYGKRPDAEIAAHLGEVLWVLGQTEQALTIWREGMLLANDNETLQSTLRRLRVTP